jgi:excinuclease ABC subunit C
MKSQYLTRHRLPEKPGVYTFRDYRKRPLYIGRATMLRDRVKSYFSADLIETRGPRIVDMVSKAQSLTWVTTDSVLEAVILESALIKRYQPFYNVDERDDRSSQYVVITEEEWPRVFLARARDFEQGMKDGTLGYLVRKYFGPFPHSGLIKEALRIIRKIFPFRDRKAHDVRHERFYQTIGQSPARTGEPERETYGRTIKYLTMFFDGKKKQIHAQVKRDMKAAVKELRFEDADRSKKLLYALDHVNDMALIKREVSGGASHSADQGKNNGLPFRIEAYDIAHLSGQNVVGAMVVSENGQLAPAEYRRFKISRERSDDVAGLMEMLSRRLNHSEWTYPDLIVVDGNKVQANAAEAVLSSRRAHIPVVAVTKDERHRAAAILGQPGLVHDHRATIIALNAECHRFAIAYHRARRSRKFMP